MSEAGAEDLALARACFAEGDEAAARLLYRRCTPSLYRLALRLTASATDAEDLVHETWLRASRGWSRFGRQAAFRTWLCGILINAAREQWRAQERRGEVSLSNMGELPSEPPALADGLDLERALEALPLGYRTVLLLHDVEGYTHEEIGHVLRIDAGTSKSQLSRARRAMLRALTR